MNTKEQWIEQTLASLDNVNFAQASSVLKQKAISKLKGGKTINIPPKIVWRAAACIALLIGINLFSISHFNKSASGTVASNHSGVFATEYFSYIDNSFN